MSVKLMVEVLDHYHGPTHRKLWLIAWAEKANDGSRTGYCKREVLAARLGRSLSRVTHIAGELEAEGTIKRLSAGVWSKAAVYELPPLDSSQGATRQQPTQGATRQQPDSATRQQPTSGAPQHPTSATRQQPDGATRQQPIPDNPDKPSSSPRRTARTGGSGQPAATDDDDDRSRAKPPPRPRPGPGYGLCPECGDWAVVKAGGGRLGSHKRDTGRDYSWCPGSHQAPAEPVPCTRCSRADVALTGYTGLCAACRKLETAEQATNGQDDDGEEFPF